MASEPDRIWIRIEGAILQKDSNLKYRRSRILLHNRYKRGELYFQRNNYISHEILEHLETSRSAAATPNPLDELSGND